MFSEQIMSYIKWFAIAEMIVAMLLIMSAYFAKFYFMIKKVIAKKNKIYLKKKLYYLLNNFKPLKQRDIRLCKKNIFILLELIQEFDRNSDLAYWSQLKSELIHKVLKPRGRKLATSHLWFNRYLATQCFYFFLEKKDEIILAELIADPLAIISINAATAAAQAQNSYLINEIITKYSQINHFLQSVTIEILSHANINIKKIIMNRLAKETNINSKIFCYRYLARLPPQYEVIPTAAIDHASDNIELKIAVINYLANSIDKSVIDYVSKDASDPHWEVRAAVAKLLGRHGNSDVISVLDKLLKDRSWWVRVNAAQALANLGNDGINILKSQKPTVDRYAYETAQHILLIIQQKESVQLG